MKNLALAIGQGNLPNKSVKSSLQKALDDRLTFSEASQLTATLLDQFPNSKNSGDGFIGSIVQVLTQYPRQVAQQIINPRKGICCFEEFLSLTKIIAWCEKQTEPLHRKADYERRIEKQIKEREEWNASRSQPKSGISYKQFLEHCETAGQKPRPVGAFEPGGYLGAKSE